MVLDIYIYFSSLWCIKIKLLLEFRDTIVAKNTSFYKNVLTHFKHFDTVLQYFPLWASGGRLGQSHWKLHSGSAGKLHSGSAGKTELASFNSQCCVVSFYFHQNNWFSNYNNLYLWVRSKIPSYFGWYGISQLITSTSFLKKYHTVLCTPIMAKLLQSLPSLLH